MTSDCGSPPTESGNSTVRVSEANPLRRSFLRHLQAQIPETEVPGPGLLARPTRHRPHIYSESEISALLAAARSLGPPGSLRPQTFSTLIGLLASCGLRASEALRLTTADLEPDTATVLRIRQTKFRKSRLVPVHPTTAATLMAYASACQHFGYARCERFFLTHRGLAPTYGSAARTFVGLARRTGIRGPVGQPGARLHDLRHTFAVQRLLALYRSGADLRARLPELAIYLGHARSEYRGPSGPARLLGCGGGSPTATEAAAIFEWLAREVSPETYVNVMSQYRPEYQVGQIAANGAVKSGWVNRNRAMAVIRGR